MKKLFVLIACLLLWSPVFALDFEEILVAGSVPIKFSCLNAHVRLIEFVLNTRLTTAQKEEFRRSFLAEAGEMDDQDKKDFLQAEELLVSMRTMKEHELKAVYDVLRSDYEQSADDAADDPSAALFLKVMKDVQTQVAEGKDVGFSRQAFNALIEYLELICGGRASLKGWVETQKAALEENLRQNFGGLPEPVQDTLNAFERRWHVLKAALAAADQAQKDKWLTELSAPFVASPTPALSRKEFLEELSRTPLWGAMASAAAGIGETETGWVATPAIPVW